MNVRIIWTAGSAAVLALICAQPSAQTRSSLAVRVAETSGIRRTTYPAGARVRFPRGTLADSSHARLLFDGK